MDLFFKDRVHIAAGTGCWEWLAHKDKNGYGRATHEGRVKGAHRISYAVHVGPIAEGMTVDHLCFNPGCVNPAHLQTLSHSENARRQRSAARTHCSAGHPFDAENTYLRPGPEVGRRIGRRNCRRCNADAARRYQKRKADEKGKETPCKQQF